MFVIIAFVFGIAATTTAQDKPDAKPPSLTDVQKLQIQNAAQAIELWQLKAQQAASEFEKARDVFQRLIDASTPPGYVINDKLELVKAPPVAIPPAAAPPPPVAAPAPTPKPEGKPKP